MPHSILWNSHKIIPNSKHCDELSFVYILVWGNTFERSFKCLQMLPSGGRICYHFGSNVIPNGVIRTISQFSFFLSSPYPLPLLTFLCPFPFFLPPSSTFFLILVKLKSIAKHIKNLCEQYMCYHMTRN